MITKLYAGHVIFGSYRC